MKKTIEFIIASSRILSPLFHCLCHLKNQNQYTICIINIEGRKALFFRIESCRYTSTTNINPTQHGGMMNAESNNITWSAGFQYFHFQNHSVNNVEITSAPNSIPCNARGSIQMTVNIIAHTGTFCFFQSLYARYARGRRYIIISLLLCFVLQCLLRKLLRFHFHL